MEAEILWTLIVISLCGCLRTVQAGCYGCPKGEYCCGNECCELIKGISGQTWTYISVGISAFFVIIIVITCCACVRRRKARQANQGVLVTTYPQQNAMPYVANTAPEPQMKTGISNSAYTGQPHGVNTPYVYTVQQQNPSGTPAAQPMKSSAFGNGSYQMDQHNYAQAHKHEHVTESRRGVTASKKTAL